MKKTVIESRGRHTSRFSAMYYAAWPLLVAVSVGLGACLAKTVPKVATVQRASRVIPESGAGGSLSITGRLVTPDGNPRPGVPMRGHPVGDLTGDLLVDGRDIKWFVLCITTDDPNAGANVGWGCWFADCNQDGVLDAADTQPFVEMLLGTRPWGVTGN